jgi:predicted anti-sigma-YlaC factor YlaD
MNCKICSALFQEYLENTLSEDLINELNNHLKVCEKCGIFFRTYSLTVTLSRQVEPPCCVSPEKIDRLMALLSERFLLK